MKKVLIAIVAIILVAIIAAGIFAWSKNEAKPKGDISEKADLLALNVFQAVNKPAWDTTNFVQWTFRGENRYLWNKRDHLVNVSWDDIEVKLNPDEITGNVFQAGNPVTNEKVSAELIQKAWSNFCNDSFWLLGFTKLFDDGVVRSIAKDKTGREGLLIEYQSGGVTPGDSYLWFLDENDVPTSYKMWVDIIPIGGLEVTWEDWITLDTGAKVAQNHKMGSVDIRLTNLKAGQTLEDLNLDPSKIQFFKS